MALFTFSQIGFGCFSMVLPMASPTIAGSAQITFPTGSNAPGSMTFTTGNAGVAAIEDPARQFVVKITLVQGCDFMAKTQMLAMTGLACALSGQTPVIALTLCDTLGNILMAAQTIGPHVPPKQHMTLVALRLIGLIE